jgi:hypothetical protein
MRSFITPILAACTSKDSFVNISDSSDHNKSTGIIEMPGGKNKIYFTK